MSYISKVDFNKIMSCYSDLGEKKIIKKSLSELNINKKVFLYYSKNTYIPICAIPKLKLVLSSKSGFLSFCYNFFHFMSLYKYSIPIEPICQQKIQYFLKISHLISLYHGLLKT
mgnify:CR=1 FL=1